MLRKLLILLQPLELLNLLYSRHVIELAESRLHVGAMRAGGWEKAGWGTCGADSLTMTLPVR
jgi:hypothetical protein